MPGAYPDRVKDTTTTSGLGAITPTGSPPAGFQGFSALSAGAKPKIGVVDGSNWMTIECTWNGTTLTRDRIIDGSSGPGVNVSLSGGSASIFVTVPSESIADVATSYCFAAALVAR